MEYPTIHSNKAVAPQELIKKLIRLRVMRLGGTTEPSRVRAPVAWCHAVTFRIMRILAYFW
jgi:hypothetical protein